MKKKYRGIILGILAMLLTMAICLQFRTIGTFNTGLATAGTTNNLRDEVLKWRDRYEAKAKELADSNKKLEKVREQTTSNNGLSLEIKDSISKDNRLLGLTDMEGSGIEITIKDDPNATKDTISVYDDIAFHVVHDNDLRSIVNSLKNAGAEAISVNGQRVVNSTAIECVGNVIMINSEKISSPFVITAIGMPERLDTALTMPGGYLELLTSDGVIATVKRMDKVWIPKYDGAITSKYMENL